MVNKKDLIVKDNALINASYNLDLAEQRLLLLAVIEARQADAPNSELTIYADSYIRRFGVHRNSAYTSLKNACDALYERRFSYQKMTKKGNIEYVRSRWVQKVSYVENEALVRITFSDDVKPLILKLEKHFTSYELDQVASLTSAYAVRLYEILMGWKSTGKTPVFKIEEFRNKLGVNPDTYIRLDHFKSRVLDFSIEQISKNTDILVSYEQHKSGRKITGFSFKFEFKKPAIDVDSTRCDKTGELGLNEPLTPQQIGYYAKLLGQSSWANHAKILQGVESKDVFSVIMRHLKNPEFYEKHKDKIDELKNANKAQNCKASEAML